MNIDRAVLALAGCVNLVAVVLTYYVSPYWLLLATFVGLNMLQASITGMCPSAMIFKALGLRKGEAFR